VTLKLDQVHRLDCLEGLGRIEPESIDLVFADPPYNIGYEYDEYDDRKDAATYLAWSRQWMQAVVRVLKPTGTFWLAIGDEYAAELKLIATGELGLVMRSWVVWYYTFGVHCTTKFTRSHTHLFYFVRDPKAFTFNDEAIRVPSARQLVYADRRANPAGRVPDDTWILRPQDLPDGFAPDEDTWYFPRVCGTFKERAGWHGCQMPEQLLGRIIRACSNPGEIVLDPFAGSGTTLAVAKKLGRRFIGFEISADYVKRVRQRLGRVRVGDPLEGAPEPLASAPSTWRGAPAADKPAVGYPQAPRTAGRSGEGRPGTSRGSVRPPRRVARPGADTRSGQELRRLARSLGRVAVAAGELSTAVAQAYLAAGEGFSIDRVLADPRLNGAFLEACRQMRIPGSPVDWNRALVRLRKAGKLAALPRPKKTVLRREQMDEYIFASEIAWQLLSHRYGLSLDGILCDPDRAAEFDRTAARFAPGWEPLHYRWGALRLRKEAKKKREYAAALPGQLRATQLQRAQRWGRGFRSIPDCGGVYLLRSNGQNLYLGETCSLRRRIRAQLAHLDGLWEHFGQPDHERGAVSVDLLPLPDSPEPVRLGLQSYLMGRLEHRPLANACYNRQAFR